MSRATPLACVLCCAASLITVPANAQQSSSEDKSESPQTGLGDIVVTAQRRAQNLQDVPIAVIAQTAAALKSADVRSMSDLTQVVPGLRANMQASYFQPYVRGVGGSSTLPANEQPVAVYIDGLYVALKEANSFELSNIERIEVLKGPQGTLFGRNATGGAINIITRTPGSQLEFTADASYGRFNDLILNGYAAGPLTDTLSIGASVRFQKTGDGYQRNIVTGSDFGTLNSLAAMGKAVWSPNADLTVTGQFIFTRRSTIDDDSATANIAVQPKGARVAGAQVSYTPYVVTQNVDPELSYNDKKAILTIRYDAGPVKFVSITGYDHGDTHNETDRDRSSAGLQLNFNNAFGRLFTQEIQAQSDNSSTFKWIVGGYYFNNREGYNPLYTRLNIPNMGTLADLASVFGRPGVSWTETTATQSAKSYAAFAEGTFALGSKTNVTAGIRYTTESRRLVGMRVNLTAPPPGTAFVYTPAASVDLSTRSSKPSWRLTLDHHFTDAVMAYASYNRGFRSGAFNPTLIAAQVALEPEVIDAYEIGSKTKWLDNRLRLNASLFYYNYRQLHVSVRSPATGVIVQQNAGGAEIYGLDVDFAAQPFENLTLSGGLNLLHARYRDYANASTFVIDPINGGGVQTTIANAQGQPLSYAPNFTANLGATYDVLLSNGSKFSLSGNYFHTSTFSRQVGTVLGAEETNAYDTVNASVTWHSPDRSYSARLWGRNLTNHKVLGSTLDSFAYSYQVQRPITFGFSLGFCLNGSC